MTGPSDLSFPDGPRLALDEALTSLLRQAERVRATQGRLRALLRATQTIVEESDLRTVLRRIVEAAVDLVEAEFGALGVLAPDADALEEFIFVGLDEEEAARIGPLPTGRGLLGALIEDPRPIRLAHLESDPRAAGSPPHHPRMDSFLGVPVRVRGAVFGNLYLTNRRGGEFTEEDEQLVAALATSAGFAIENARLLDEARVRAEWMSTAVELSAALLTTSSDTAFDLVAGRLSALPGVDQVSILLADDDGAHLSVVAARGEAEAGLRGLTLEAAALTAGEAVTDVRPHAQARTAPASADPTRVTRDGSSGPIVVIPLHTKEQVWGVLAIARDPDRPRFRAVEIEIAADLAARVSVALELGRAREERQRSMLVEDRQRIARDLHDHVIQQLFGTILSLQAVAGKLAPGAHRDGVSRAVDQLDDAISQIRTVVFALTRSTDESVRHRVIDIVAELSPASRRPPSIRFTGPVDHTIEGDLRDDVTGVVRELVANAVRHARADRIAVELGAVDGEVFVRVQDDGIGMAGPTRIRGLENLSHRAAARGGTFRYTTGDDGTASEWRVPTPRAAEREGTA